MITKKPTAYLIGQEKKDYLDKCLTTGGELSTATQPSQSDKDPPRLLKITAVIDETPATGHPYKYRADVYYCQFNKNGTPATTPAITGVELWLDEKPTLTTSLDYWFYGKWCLNHYEGVKKKD